MALDFPNSPTNGQLYTSNNVTWEYDSSTTTWDVKYDGVAGTTRVAVLEDKKAQNSGGGTSLTADWNIRVLNTKTDPSDFVNFGGGTTGVGGNNTTFSLAAGTYSFQWRAPAWDTTTMRARLAYSTSSGFSSGVSYIYGESAEASSSPSPTFFAAGKGIVTITETTHFRIEHYTSNGAATNGLGNPNNITGVLEVYTQVIIEDLYATVKDNATYVDGTTKVASVTDVKGNTDPGGPITANTWTTRDLNTISDPATIGVSVSSDSSGTGNYITIPAGTYKITWRCPSWRIYTYQTKLEYSTDNTFATGVSKVIGSSEFSSSTDNNNVSATSSEGIAPSLTFTQETYVRIRQWAGVTGPSYSGGSNGLGVATYNDVALTYSGESSLYTIVQIEDLATAVKDNATYVEGTTKVALLKDEKDEGVAGGSFTQGGWKDRNLTVKEDPQGFINFTAGGPTSTAGTQNQPGYWSLPSGDYLIEWSAPAHNVTKHQSMLVYSSTESHISTAGLDGSASYVLGSSEDVTAGGSGGDQSISVGSKVITIPAATTYWFKIMHRCESDAFGEGMGQDTPGWGTKEIYTQVKIKDLATAVKNNTTYVEGTSKVATVKDQRARTTTVWPPADTAENGGDAAHGPNIRKFNTIDDAHNIGITLHNTATIGNGFATVIKVPAGTYRIRWSAPAWDVGLNNTVFQYSTSDSVNVDGRLDSSVTSVQGSSEFAATDETAGGVYIDHSQTSSTGVIASVTFTQDIYFQLSHWCDQAQLTFGLGSANYSSNAGDSVFSQVEIEDLATAVKKDTSSIIKQIKHVNGPSVETSYNGASWTTIVQESITLTTSNNVLVNVKAGFYGGSEGSAYQGGRLLRTTSSTDTDLWSFSSIWGRISTGPMKAAIDGPTIVDTPGAGTHTYQWQTYQHDNSGLNDIVVPANGNSITLTEYT